MTWKPDVCIYHYPCQDGFAAAWTVWKRFRGEDIRFIPTNYGDKPPEELEGKRVFIVDFSYPAETLREMGKEAESIVVLDHHKTAEEDLNEFHRVYFWLNEETGDIGKPSGEQNIFVYFDKNRSGAMLAWEFCFRNVRAPFGIELVQDRDLWKYFFADTRRFHLYLQTLPEIFTERNRVYENVHDYLPQAYAVEKFYDSLLLEVLQDNLFESFAGYEDIPVVIAPLSMASDLGHELLQMYPDAPFAAVKYYKSWGVKWSLRSNNERADVSEIARIYGGGGHRNAAGFVWDFRQYQTEDE